MIKHARRRRFFKPKFLTAVSKRAKLAIFTNITAGD
jgi:hypothetical protein